MAKYTGPKCKLSRRLGTDLMHKSGVRDFETKCKAKRPPGMHADAKQRLSDYGVQLREKQKIRHLYGVLEKQFRNYYKKATRLKGSTGENLLMLLESRLDNVVYRMGFATTRAEARQLVNHGHFTVNGRKSDVASHLMSVGDVIEVKQKSKSSEKFKELVENHQGNVKPWLQVDVENLQGKVISEPSREDIELPIEEHLIVERYSK